MFVITYAPKFNMHSEFHKVWIKERCEKTKLCSSFKVVPYFQEHCQMHQRQKESSHMFFICIFLNVLFHRILKTTLAWVTKLIHPSLSRTVPVLTWSLPQSQGNNSHKKNERKKHVYGVHWQYFKIVIIAKNIE